MQHSRKGNNGSHMETVISVQALAFRPRCVVEIMNLFFLLVPFLSLLPSAQTLFGVGRFLVKPLAFLRVLVLIVSKKKMFCDEEG